MHNFTASFAEVAVLGLGMTLLMAWVTYMKTVRIRASLLDLAQDYAQTSAHSAKKEARSSEALRTVSAKETTQRGP